MQTKPRFQTLFIHAGAIVVSLLFASCISLAPHKLPVNIYVLELPNNTLSVPKPLHDGPVIAVNVPRAVPGYDTDKMAYMRTTGQLEYFALHRWADQPAAMLQPLLVQTLDGIGFFKTAIQSPSPLKMDFVLDSEILRLRQVFSSDSSSTIEFALRVQLVTADRVLATKVFSETVPTFEATPPGGVTAINNLLETLFPRIASFCATEAKAVFD